MKSLIFCLITTFITCSVYGQQVLNEEDNIRTLLQKTRKNASIPAIAVAVIKDGKIVLTSADGFIQDGKDDTVSINSKFHLGSNTKAITSFIAAKLIEDGKMRWDDKLIDAFPAYKDSILSDYQLVTFGELLSHRAKIRPYTSGVEFLNLDIWKGSISERRLAFTKYILRQKPKIDSAKSFNYSNAGYAIAALMMEKATGKSWEELVQKTMNELKFSYSLVFPNRSDSKQPWGHLGGKSTGPKHDYKLENYVASAGDISMNIVDYANFVLMHQRGLQGENNYLRSETYQKLHFGLPEYGFGWGNQMKNGNKVSYHDGSAGSFYCHTIINSKLNLGVVIIANAASQKTVEGIYALQGFLGKKYGK